MYHILDTIKGPKDLKKLNKKQLKYLAREIRHFLLCSVSKTGGHLASNLGAVELTIALHYIFNSPTDKIVWDVGHQAYPHKLLTGRKNKFNTLRKYKGLSGFPKREESKHDQFDVGHASTSISAALGMAVARDIKGLNNKVIAVIGDGALTGGMALEALNNEGHMKKNMIIVLNDNEMSISPNVGAFSSYLTRKTSDPRYNRFKSKLYLWMKKNFGRTFARFVMHVEEIFTVYPRGLVFEELGYRYFGPIDGHNITELINTLNNIKHLDGPILLHIMTKKGKGYKIAEENACKFHGVSPFNLHNGEKLKCVDTITYTEAFSQALIKLAKQDSRITAITAAMPDGTGLNNFKKIFPKRFFDVGIAEQHAVTFAAGMATQGLKPVCTIYSSFLQRGYDQLVHDICLQKLPVVFAIDRAGLVGDDGPTHHGVFDLSYLRHLPNMVVMSPKDENELQHMLKTAISYNGPVALRYPRGCGLGINMSQKLKNIKIGESETILEGKDILLLAIGNMVHPCIKASGLLKKRKINAAVINARFVKPLDKKIIERIKKIKKVLIVEENTIKGGFGSAVLEEMAKNNIHAKVKLLGIPDKFIEQGTQAQLREEVGLTIENIFKEALRCLKSK